MAAEPLLIDAKTGLPRIAVSEVEAGKILGVSAKSLQRARMAGQIKFFRMGEGGKVLIRISELQRFAKSREATA